MRSTLSIIIPNYNHGHYLKNCLNSIFRQSRIPDEVIVIDDASTDDSLTILNEFKNYPGLKVVKNESNLGPIPTIVKGLKIATSDYIFGHSADDFLLPGFVEKSMAALERWSASICATHPAFMGVEGKIDLNEKQPLLSSKSCYFSPEELVDILRPDKFWIAGHTSIVNRVEFLNATKNTESLKWHWDWFGLNSVALRKGLCYIPEPLAVLRTGNESYSSLSKRSACMQADVLWNMTVILNRPENRDIKEKFLESSLLLHYPEFEEKMREMLIPWGQQMPKRYMFGLSLANEMRKALKKEVNLLKSYVKASEFKNNATQMVFLFLRKVKASLPRRKNQKLRKVLVLADIHKNSGRSGIQDA